MIWQKKLFEIKDKKKNNDFVKEIKNRWSKIKDEIEEMSEEKKEESNKMLKNCWRQSGEDIKILTPNQMLSRLPISLAQLEEGNNSNKFKNEIRQLLYSLYHSKNMTKQVYNNLIKHIWIKNIIIVHKIFIMIMIIIIITIHIIKNGDNFYEYWK